MNNIKNKTITVMLCVAFVGSCNISFAKELNIGMKDNIDNAQIMLPDEMPEPDLTKADRFIVKYKDNQNPGIQLYNNGDIDAVDYDSVK